ncbi:hypothetical protein GO988_11365 [Hymenobacter sp. HMF4947]|uniref:Uncharacterized protein n=1 Tax=Hymenobacter ginkgonis TaxID=2682976 RepID=A0A7K1TET7_9BACT|nr:hypothetical protein [Hymenobacter ginkgonis]MVN76923.1 hypothetical protein [Hymenobacter ginkgonis]
MLPPNPNTKTARQLLVELKPGKDIVMYDPKSPKRVISQCVRVSEHVYYLTGPQFNDFTAQLRHPILPVGDDWLLPDLFSVAKEDSTTEAEMVDVMNFFLRDHGAGPEELVLTCSTAQDAIATLAGLFAAHGKRPKP